MKSKIRWGILGCGKIAHKFAADLKLVKNAELVAVGAREQSKASEFANDFQVKSTHNSYEALVQNPDVDAIYIATPHSHHHEHALLCLNHGKAVLCEKAFAINHREAHEMISLARSKGIFIMEAFWTRFLPHYQIVKKYLAEEKLGAIKSIRAEFGFKPTPPVSPRLYDPALGGGSLLDIGVYPVFLALDILGKPDFIDAAMTPSSTGMDEQCSIQFRYANGAMAQLFSSFSSNMATGADINGTDGRLRMTHRFHGPTTSLEFYPGIIDSREMISFESAKGNGYEYEAQHVTDCLLKRLTESPMRTHADTLLLMETLDIIRGKCGIIYPADR
jgi:Predicted dehydrogenases and related proteins